MELTWVVALVALVAMIVGEVWRTAAPATAQEMPLAQSTAVALAMATAWPMSETRPAHLLGIAGPLLLVMTAVLLVGAVRGRLRHTRGDIAQLAASVVLAGLMARAPLPGGSTLLKRSWEADVSPAMVALVLMAVAVAAVVVPLLARAISRGVRGREAVQTAIGAELGRAGPVALATSSTAVVMALALGELGVASLVLFLVPLLVLQPAVVRQRRIRMAQRETIFALARLPEEAGLTGVGHGARVAALAVPVAREVGVEGADLPDVEAAALLHDIGQVGLASAVPGGATVEVSARDQRRIAGTGSAILARTAELSRLAGVVGDVGIPHHRAVERGDVSRTASIVRVVSAYDDLTHPATRLSGGGCPVDALDRILRNTPHDYDPQVVDALIRQLERRGVLAATEAASLRS